MHYTIKGTTLLANTTLMALGYICAVWSHYDTLVPVFAVDCFHGFTALLAS
jgi:hypothetical protein